jgi:cell pole-organizing protein PopZ
LVVLLIRCGVQIIGTCDWHRADALHAWSDAGDDDDHVESAMTQPAKVQEPSMEEILASIRRIIADDEDKPVANAKPSQNVSPQVPNMAKPAPAAVKSQPIAPAAKAPEPAIASNNQDDIDALLAGFDGPSADAEPEQAAALEDDVFELTDDMALPAEASFRRVDATSDVEFTEAVAASERLRASIAEAASSEFPSFAPQPQAAFHQPQMLSQSTASSVESAFNALASTVLSNNARTLEDLVKEMLRPMLKSWLDDNLPVLVERIVKAEIERVSRGR